MASNLEQNQSNESLRQTKKCAYCSKEMEDDAIKCPNCHSWTPEIKRTSTEQYVSLGALIIMSALISAIFFRIALVRGVFGSISWDVRAALQNPLFIIATVAFIIVLVIFIMKRNKLERMMKREKK
mgnify:CR=1 FL=1